MNGFRVAGNRKVKLMKKLNKTLDWLKKKGIKGSVYLKKEYGITKPRHLEMKFNTKQMSGLISELRRLAV